MSCHAFKHRVDAQRETWFKDLASRPDLNLRIFVGRGSSSVAEDTVILDAPDDYKGFPQKVQAMRRWALEHGYEDVLKLDDDTFVAVDRLKVPRGQDYTGRLRGPSGGYPAPYCSGFAYWNSAKALRILVEKEWSGDIYEDRWTGNALLQAGIAGRHESGYQVVWSKRNALSGREVPLQGNRVVIACEFTPQQMKEIYQDYKAGIRTKYRQPSISSGSLDRVAVMVKTFLRDGALFACLEGLKRNFPDVKLVVVDDGWSSPEKVVKYAELISAGHACTWMPFDSGFGSKANAAIADCDRDYVLIASDDFDFSDPRVRPGINRMVQVLDSNPSIGVASGRVDNRPYEFCLENDGPSVVREVKRFHGAGVVPDSDTRFHLCDLTVNYSLVRRKVLDTVRWDGGDVKIGGGEHAAFFLDVKEAGWRVCVVEGANINQFKFNPTWQHKTYGEMRRRARQAGRPCLKRRGVEKYILADGTEEIS